MFRNRVRLIGLAVMTGLLFSIILASGVLAGPKNNEFTTVYDMRDNGTFVPGGSNDDFGNGAFRFISPNALNNLKFSVTVDVSGLDPGEQYGISVSVRDLGTPATAGPDGDVEVGKAIADDLGNLKFTGTAILPNPMEVSADGATNADPLKVGWRIDQRITLVDSNPSPGLNKCVDCVLVCAPTTKVILNEQGTGLVQK